MTRINLVPAVILTDDHLRGEYKEITRVFTAVRKAVAAGKTPADFDIPPRFVLGKGHVTFFYNKISWLRGRYSLLNTGMRGRGFDVDLDLFNEIQRSADQIPNVWSTPWVPRPEDVYLSMARLVKMSKLSNVLKELQS